MRLRAITIRRMPGIDRTFRVGELAEGLNLIVGPNGSGKTTLCRAVRALLWPEVARVEPIALDSEWEDGGAAVRVKREAGQVTWERASLRAERPDLPADRFARCFSLGVRDLLLPDRPTDAAIAGEIRNQMSGGYDVGALVDGLFAARPQEGRTEDQKIRRLQDRLRALRNEGSALADEEDRARELEEQLAAAREAAERLGPLRTALKVAQARAGLEEVRQELAGLPEGMERIDGGEEDRIGEVEADLAEVREELARCRRSREEAERAIEGETPPGGPTDEAELKAWLDRARQLERLEADLTAAEEARVKAEAGRENARAALSPLGSAGPPARLGAEELARIELFLHRVDRLRAQRSALEAERRLLGEGARRDGPSRRQLEQGIEALERWLQAANLQRRVRTGWAGSTALAAVLAGAAAGLLLHWAGWVLCGAGLGGLLLLLWMRSVEGKGGGDRADFEATDLAAPEAWEPGAVRERRRELKDDLDLLLEDDRTAGRRSALDGRLAALAETEAELDVERQALRTALGVDPGGGDVGLVVLADRVQAWHAANEEKREAEARVRLLADRCAELRERIRGFACAADAGEHVDAAGLIRRLEDLSSHAAALREARRGRDSQAAREEDLLREIEKLERRRDELFRRAGLEPRDREGLSARIRLLERYRELRAREDRHREAVEESLPELAGREDLLKLSAGDLASEIAGQEALASETDKLSHDIGAIEEAVRRARGDDSVERLLAELAAARDELADRLAAKLERAAGAFLLTSILEEYDRASRPEVLNRAADLFARFTRHAYELLLDPRGGEPELRARETASGKGRSLAELSDGTRVQLLLAARLAFATQADRGRPVPLFLDEVLTTSDPARFAAVAQSLLVLVREEGRQVFYLTSNPADAERWRALLEPEEREGVRTVDLAEVRRLALAAGAPGEIEVPPQPEPPSPEGLSAGEYGLAIGAPRLEPRRPVGELHLIHLLHDDLSLLHALLREGISTLGQWRLMESLGRAVPLAGAERAARLSALGDLAEAFREAWLLGRGRPVDPDALRRADGVTEAYRDRVTELAAELGGDAARLVRVLQDRSDERVSGFREKKLEELRNWLIGEGYLDPREQLEPSALQTRVLSAMAPHLQAGRLSSSDVAAHVRRLLALAG